jgi:hypothetical protein
VLCFLLFQKSFSQNYNRPVHNGLPLYEFKKYDNTVLNSHYLFSPFKHKGSGTSLKPLMILDEDGYLAWFTATANKKFDFKYHPDHSVYSFTERRNGIIWHFIMNNNFNIIDSVTVPTDIGDVHEFLIFQNGNYCFLGLKDSIMDLSTDTINGIQGDTNSVVLDLVIWELDINKNIVFKWKALDHIPPKAFVDNYSYNPAGKLDFVHGNAIELDNDNNLLVCMRTADAVYKIDHITGDVIWRLGGNYNEFNFVNDSGFYGQHDIRRLPNGNITIFDNQFLKTSGSRSVEYMLDTNLMTATKVKEYAYDWTLKCHSMGSYRKLPNGYEIFGWGNTRRPEPSITLIDSFHNKAADIFFEDTIVTYRAFFQELNNFPTRPQISCINNGGNVTLTAPSGYNYYTWSSGQSTQSITVSDTGTYMVWVNHGIGMLGSAPFYLTDMQTQCSVTGINELVNKENEIEGYYDLSGKKINKVAIRGIYIIRYKNGRISKKKYRNK